ncbi:MAG: prolipoprotein diacylglyceryl transferase [Anaerolineaceae bacterium]
MPQGFSIGPVTIRYYALIILAGALVAAWIASTEANRRGKDKDMIWDMLPWLLVGGILGARIWHVLTPSASNVAMGLTTQYYFQHPLQILMIWKGGLGIPGGVIGGSLALWIYTRVKKDSFLEWADMISPGLLVAQAIGRWGNFVNQELYGGPSNLPWAITIDPQYRLPGFEAVETYHPLFLYECLLNLLAAGLLLLIARKMKDKLYKGDVFLLYLIFYPVIRFGLEYLRLDPSPVNGININQTVMAVVAVTSGLLLLFRHSVKPPKEVVAVEQEGIDVSDMKLVEVSEGERETLEAGPKAEETAAAIEATMETTEGPVEILEVEEIIVLSGEEVKPEQALPSEEIIEDEAAENGEAPLDPGEEEKPA